MERRLCSGMEMNIKRKAEKEGERPTSWSYLISHTRGTPSSQGLFGHRVVCKLRLARHTADHMQCVCACVYVAKICWTSLKQKQSRLGHFGCITMAEKHNVGVTIQWRWPNQQLSNVLSILSGIMAGVPARRGNICHYSQTHFLPLTVLRRS